jgi:hypothetical protein
VHQQISFSLVHGGTAALPLVNFLATALSSRTTRSKADLHGDGNPKKNATQASGNPALIPYTPYITTWSEEGEPALQIIELSGRGIAYSDERVTDRDSHGVLWFRTPCRPAEGTPLFSKVHPLRQRRAMLRLLCGVCGQPASQTDDGVLWLLQDFRGDWPGWPERMAVTEPPVCLSCVPVATRLCPALRTGAVAARARRFPVVGVRGVLYRGGSGSTPRPVEEINVAYDDRRVRWVRATNLLRELHDCEIVEVDEPRAAPSRSRC